MSFKELHQNTNNNAKEFNFLNWFITYNKAECDEETWGTINSTKTVKTVFIFSFSKQFMETGFGIITIWNLIIGKHNIHFTKRIR